MKIAQGWVSWDQGGNEDVVGEGLRDRGWSSGSGGRFHIPKNVGITIGYCDGYEKEKFVDGNAARVLKYSGVR